VVVWNCPPPPQTEQVVCAPARHQPTINWPEDFGKPLEQPEQEHPSDEDQSPLYSGLAATANTNASPQRVVHDSGATGSLYTTVPTAWLQVGPYLVEKTRDLNQGERLQAPWALATDIEPDTKKHLASPSARKIFQARPGGRGSRS
jgi:hypothetical protein